MFKIAVPLFHVSSSAAAEHFYCNLLGFKKDFAHRNDEAVSDPCYMGLSRDRIWIVVSSFPGDGVAGGVANVLVDNVDALHAEFVAKDIAIDLAPINQTWGSREMYVKDADGNCLRFIQT